jgi:hypothetical protein
MYLKASRFRRTRHGQAMRDEITVIGDKKEQFRQGHADLSCSKSRGLRDFPKLCGCNS